MKLSPNGISEPSQYCKIAKEMFGHKKNYKCHLTPPFILPLAFAQDRATAYRLQAPSILYGHYYLDSRRST